MNKTIILGLLLVIILATCTNGLSQETPVKYDVKTRVNIDYTHGQIQPTMGVHNIQIMRANREFPETAEGYGWTYNHGANIAYWNNKLYVNYLSNPTGEHIAPGQTYLQSSEDGYNWTFPKVLFPTYRIPDGTTKEGKDLVAKNLDAVMHQRMGFYLDNESNRLFALGFYGICLDEHDKPNDGNGIGRVIREIKKDGSFGKVYFIRYNNGWGEENTSYPKFSSSNDKSFVSICEKILKDPLVTLQWKEESSKNDPIIPKINGRGKAFCYYTLEDGSIIGMWKSQESGISKDGGKTWSIGKTEGLFTNSAKMWGERTSDGLYAQVYNPSSYRWPMAISVSKDGLNYNNVSLVHGDISSMRYNGREKSYGPQYLRGIMPGNGVMPDKNMWLSYSINKEDIWVSRVTIPVVTEAKSQIQEDLSTYNDISELARWNIYSPVWAPVSIGKLPDGRNALRLADRDKYDYAKVEHLFPGSESFELKTKIVPSQNNTGQLCIELQNEKNSPAVRVSFDPDGMIRAKRNYKYKDVSPYLQGEEYDVKIEVDLNEQIFTVYINEEKKISEKFFAPMNSFSKVVFRTGQTFKVPTPDSPPIVAVDLNKSGDALEEAVFHILSVKTIMK